MRHLYPIPRRKSRVFRIIPGRAFNIIENSMTRSPHIPNKDELQTGTTVSSCQPLPTQDGLQRSEISKLQQ